MPITQIPITSTTLSTSASSVTFSSIPSTYNDLLIRLSARNAVDGGYNSTVTTNITSTLYSDTWLYTLGASVNFTASTNATLTSIYGSNLSTNTSGNFGTGEIYIPAYTVAQNKPFISFGTGPNNSASSNAIGFLAHLIRSTTAINSITITAVGGTFAADSTFALYGINNS